MAMVDGNATPRGGRRLLVISPIPTHPQNEGCNQRVFAMLSAIRSLGHDVHFVYVDRHKGDVEAMRQFWGGNFHHIAYHDPEGRATKFLVKIKSRLRIPHDYDVDAWFDNSVKTEVLAAAAALRPDAVLVEYVYMSKALDWFDRGVLRIIDTHDAMTGRHAKLLASGHRPRWFSTTEEEEGRGLRRADVVVAIQELERAFFERISGRRVVTVGHLVNVNDAARPGGDSLRILFIGTNNPSNVDAAQFLLREIMPLVRERIPDAEVVLAGKVCEAVADMSGCRKLGVVADLAEAYRETSVVVNPVRFGTGLKIKNIEALGYCRPLVTTGVGAEGMEDGIGSAFMVGDGAPALADAVVAIATESALDARLRAGARAYAEAWNRKHTLALAKLLEVVA